MLRRVDVGPVVEGVGVRGQLNAVVPARPLPGRASPPRSTDSAIESSLAWSLSIRSPPWITSEGRRARTAVRAPASTCAVSVSCGRNVDSNGAPSRLRNVTRAGDEASSTWASVTWANVPSTPAPRAAAPSSTRSTSGSPGPTTSCPSPFGSTQVDTSVDPDAAPDDPPPHPARPSVPTPAAAASISAAPASQAIAGSCRQPRHDRLAHGLPRHPAHRDPRREHEPERRRQPRPSPSPPAATTRSSRPAATAPGRTRTAAAPPRSPPPARRAPAPRPPAAAPPRRRPPRTREARRPSDGAPARSARTPGSGRTGTRARRRSPPRAGSSAGRRPAARPATGGAREHRRRPERVIAASTAPCRRSAAVRTTIDDGADGSRASSAAAGMYATRPSWSRSSPRPRRAAAARGPRRSRARASSRRRGPAPPRGPPRPPPHRTHAAGARRSARGASNTVWSPG